MASSRHPEVTEALREEFHNFLNELEGQLAKILQTCDPKNVPATDGTLATDQGLKKWYFPLADAKALSNLFVSINNVEAFVQGVLTKFLAVEVLFEIWPVPVKPVAS